MHVFQKSRFCQAVTFYMESKKMTLLEASKKSGLSVSTFSRVTNSSTDFGLDTYLKLCNFIGRSPGDFFKHASLII